MRWLADENFNNDILRALRRRSPSIDIVRAQDVGLTGVDDEAVLAWAAEQDRVLLTHDVSTITGSCISPGDERRPNAGRVRSQPHGLDPRGH